MEWTGEAIEQLRVLWAEGHSTAEIGRRMGISKNAVVGKAHRLSLPPRPSPIRRGTASQAQAAPAIPRRDAPALRPQPPAAARQPGAGALPAALPRPVQAPPTPSGAAPGHPAAPPRMARPAAPAVAPAAPAAAPAAAAAVVRPFPRTSLRACCWPMGEPGTPEFRFCGGEAIPSKPYCAEHAAIAYVKVRDRREDAA